MSETVDKEIVIANIGAATVPTQLLTTLAHLHDSLIQHAVGLGRLFYIQDVSAWNEWSTDVAEFEDLTPHEACDKFLHEVLPIVNTYQLATKVKKRLRLLDLHPCFRRIKQGYQYVPNAELSTCFLLKANRDFRLASALPTSNDSAQASHTVLINDAATKQRLSVGYNFKISPETASLFSAMVSNDLELSIGQRHDLAEIHRRLRQAKQSFEDTARVLPFRRNVHNLVYEMDIYVNLRTKICKAINKNYHY
ncbi:uncharacterized protein LOC117583383 [Drosophila guanche]|uniref:uncharacterized protein LOC117583383 n=1 Tax=Drosophila guanche TaxID=7266 RepID=UPI001471A2ED|nr:uncharacterized protein LOC117583383 [Drosophila guanche]